MTPRTSMIAALIAAGLSAGAGPPANAKKLIEFGWDEPDTAFLRAHVVEMEATPFDGCVFHANVPGPDGRPVNFAWKAWGHRAFTLDELGPAIGDLRATRFGRFADNFLRFNVTPGDVDWSDDFAPILANARVAAEVARRGNCRGILFDTEPYEGPIFDHRKRPHAADRAWDESAAQARLRGRQVMSAFVDGYPGLVVLLTFGHSYPWKQSGGGKIRLADCDDGLLAPFLDGMIEATRGGARLVDAHELSYGYRDPDQFDRARRTIVEGVLPIVGRPGAYREAVGVGFGIWLDYDWPKHGWDEADPSRNYFTPSGFGASVRRALEVSDEYVWIYTEKPRWWTDGGSSERLPSPYSEALRAARSGLAKD